MLVEEKIVGMEWSFELEDLNDGRVDFVSVL